MLLYFIQIIQLSIIMSLKKNGCNNYCLWILWFDLIAYQIELLEKNVNGNLTIKLYDKLDKYNFSMTTSHTYVSIYHRYMLMEFMFLSLFVMRELVYIRTISETTNTLWERKYQKPGNNHLYASNMYMVNKMTFSASTMSH